MATLDDLAEARELLVAGLDVDNATAVRIADLIAQFYSVTALTRPRELVLLAARWAVEQVNALPATQRTRVTPTWVASLTQHRDCPLCMGGSTNRGGSDPEPTPKDAPKLLRGAGA